jgi:hypothetical protein
MEKAFKEWKGAIGQLTLSPAEGLQNTLELLAHAAVMAGVVYP